MTWYNHFDILRKQSQAVRERTQPGKIQIKQCSKMNSARSEGKPVPATAWMRVAERREPAMPTSRLIAMLTLAASHVSRETSQVRGWKWTVGIGCVKTRL